MIKEDVMCTYLFNSNTTYPVSFTSVTDHAYLSGQSALRAVPVVLNRIIGAARNALGNLRPLVAEQAMSF